MDTPEIFQLYPPVEDPGVPVHFPLKGLYLRHDLRAYAAQTGEPFVYSSYVASADGRIAVPHASKPGLTVPAAIANDRDWRLFQELAVQADVILTSGRYLRDYADGRAQEILRVYDDPAFADLKAWRLARGLAAYPALAVISASLDFPVSRALTSEGREVVVITTAQADPTRKQTLAAQTGRVLIAGEQRVEGASLVAQLAARGYRTICNATGPKVLHMLLADRALHRLYLTCAHRILGGQPFSSIVEGPLLSPPVDLRLAALYLDLHALGGAGQMFTVYELSPPENAARG